MKPDEMSREIEKVPHVVSMFYMNILLSIFTEFLFEMKMTVIDHWELFFFERNCFLNLDQVKRR